MKKRVILFIIDALSSQMCVPAIKEGRLPNLAKLVEHGFMKEESVSIFPSLTPAATSTIVTGDYPKQHGVLGFHWFDRKNQEVAYYGDDFWIVNALGFGEFFDDCLRKLNGKRLTSTTIFERLADEEMKSASFNFLIFRGKTKHKAEIPLWFSWHPKVPFKQELMGPDFLYFGDFVETRDYDEEAPRRSGGLLGRFGFNDSSTADLVNFFAEDDKFPEFTLAYFPDHDYKAHDEGLESAFSQVEEFDSTLGALFEVYGGPEKMLDKFNIVVTGDHSQTDTTGDAEECKIFLESLLEGFPLAQPGEWNDSYSEKLMAFADMRCAQVYSPQTDQPYLSSIARQVLEDARVDQVLWRDEESGFIRVATSDRGECRFKLSKNGRGHLDDYGNKWIVEGQLSAVDAALEEGRVQYGDYPNALERIWGGLTNESSADIWLTSNIGYEFVLDGVKAHVGGGSHGSMHKLDSLSPLIVGGVRSAENLPEKPRLVDVCPLCLELLGV